MSVIDSLSAGYRFVWRRPDLLLIPLILDLFLWLSPRLSIGPLLQRLADFYVNLGDMADLSEEMQQLSGQMQDMLTTLGQSSNLMDLLVNRTLFHVPSLLVSIPAIKSGQSSIEVSSTGSALLFSLLLGLCGVLIGVVYMNLLAQALPLGEGEKATPPQQFVSQVVRHWGRTILFVIGVFVLLAIFYLFATIGTSLLMLLSPALGMGVMALASGLTAIFFFYLYFVTAGLVLDNLPVPAAVTRSIVLVRHNFWATLFFVVLTGLIALGMSLVLENLVAWGTPGVLVAVASNAFIGTGLAMALLVFYRTRLLVLAEQIQNGKTQKP